MRRWLLIPLMLAVALISGTDSLLAGSDARQDIVSIKAGDIRITVDPRIELLSAVAVLSNQYAGGDLLADADLDYVRNMRAYFAPFKTHQAVVKFDELVQQGFTQHKPVTAVLLLNQQFRVCPDLVFNQSTLSPHISQQDVLTFLGLLEQFAAESDFAQFYQRHTLQYQLAIADLSHQLAPDNDNPASSPINSRVVVLAPAIANHGFTPDIQTRHGQLQQYSINGPLVMALNNAEFGNRGQH